MRSKDGAAPEGGGAWFDMEGQCAFGKYAFDGKGQ